jgi:hypothetical protein
MASFRRCETAPRMIGAGKPLASDWMNKATIGCKDSSVLLEARVPSKTPCDSISPPPSKSLGASSPQVPRPGYEVRAVFLRQKRCVGGP